MGGRTELEFGLGRLGGEEPRPPRDEEGPFRLLLIGDFSGRAGRRSGDQPSPPALRRPVEVDASDVEAAMRALAPTLRIGPSGADESVTFAAVDDFHPDSLFGRLRCFAEPRRLRAALAVPAPSDEVFAAAEDWLARWNAGAGKQPSARGALASSEVASPADEAVAGAGAAGPAGSGESTESTLQRLLGRGPARSTGDAPNRPPTDARGAMQSLIESVVRPHVIRDVGTRRAPMLAAFDEALTTNMRAIVTEPSFRALEGTWRAAERVLRSVDTDSDLRIALFDAGKDDLVAALASSAGGELESSALHRLLVGADEHWSMMAADFAVELDDQDLRLVAALGAIASRAGGPFVAGGSPALLGCATWEALVEPATWRSPDDAAAGPLWRALRESPLAPFIGLALPRVLARLPYGRKTDPIDSFAFQELPPGSDTNPREHRLWSSAAFAVAQACGAAFREGGWPVELPGQPDIDDLPTHTYDDGGEQRLVPCAEVALGERAAAAILSGGLIPLVARRDRGAVRVAGLASIAHPQRLLRLAR